MSCFSKTELRFLELSSITNNSIRINTAGKINDGYVQLRQIHSEKYLTWREGGRNCSYRTR